MNHIQPGSASAHSSSRLRVLGLLLGMAVHTASAQLVEVSADIKVTNFRESASGPAVETHWGFSTSCLLGTNSWLIKDNALRNSKQCWWFTGSNIVLHCRVTKEPLVQDIRDALNWGSDNVLGLRDLHWRTTLSNVYPSTNGCPPVIRGPCLTWLAFCSGPFLRTAGRKIPAPLYRFLGEDYSDKTLVFDDSAGLPRRVEFYTTDTNLLCRYEVTQSTNRWGRTFPLEFQVTLYHELTWKRRSRAVGKVTSISKAERFEVPAEVRTVLGQ